MVWIGTLFRVTSHHVAIASCTPQATAAAQHIVESGGNAFDAAVACAFDLVASNPLFCSLGGSGFATIKQPGSPPQVIDFFSTMPGKGLPSERLGQNLRMVEVAYGPGVQIIHGHASVGVPGTAKGLEYLAQNFGTLPLCELVQPAIADARSGAPVHPAMATWLAVSAEKHHWLTPYSKQLLTTPTGGIPAEGDILKNPDLADTLTALGEHGADLLYHGDLGRHLAEVIQSGGGLITPEDLNTYEVLIREPVIAELGDYRIFTNPPPSVGGCSLVQMLKVSQKLSLTSWTPQRYALFARVIETALKDRYSFIEEGHTDFNQLFNIIEDDYISEKYGAIISSPHTTQISTADTDGNACCLTMSMGYGSGVAIDGTGILMDNILGELELNPFGFHGLPPGQRLVSNMSPSIALNSTGSDLIAIGTPGASRITSALAQVLLNLIQFHMPLTEALTAPRIHWEADQVLYEPGITLDINLLPPNWTLKPFDGLHMYFGGVQAARVTNGNLDAASDPRRNGQPGFASVKKSA